MSAVRMQTVVIIMIAANVLPLNAASPDLLFQAGNKAYLDGNYKAALSNWRQIETMEYEGDALFYNMGNAYYKLSQSGMAILYWEKALKLAGEDEDLKVNLRIAEARLTDEIERAVTLPVWNWIAEIRAMFSDLFLSLSGIIIMAFIFSILTLRRWVIRGEFSRIALKQVMIVLIVLMTIDITLILLQVRDEHALREGIVIQNTAEILSAPAVGTGKLLFTLHEGSKVRVIRGMEGWYEISFGSGKQGWVNSNKIGII